MKRRHTCEESEEKWKRLFALAHFGRNSKRRTGNRAGVGDEIDEKDNIFDCRSMKVPRTHALVEGVMDEYIAKWKALDDRRIIQDQDAMRARHVQEDDGGKILPPTKRKYRRGGWEYTQDQLLQLPPKFDYATTRDQPPFPGESLDPNDKVVDLLNPSRHSSYSQELWKLFASIPTVEEITAKARANARIPNTLSVHREIVEGTQRAQRMDAHALCRLRMSDRHGLPPPAPVLSEGEEALMIGTIRLEFWRKQPRRGSNPDPRRMVLEFLSSQTLLEVHEAIVHMTEDDGWTQNNATHEGCFFIEETFYSTKDNEAAPKITGATQDEGGDDDDHVARKTAETSTNVVDDDGNGDEAAMTAGTASVTVDEEENHSSTRVDYMAAIVRWLDGEKGVPNPTRRKHLGIATSNRFRQATPMKDTKLKDIPFRLGVRYYHVMHGDVECSMMVTDKRLVPTNTSPQYPIVHDIWMPNYFVPICEACERFVAIYVYFHRGTPAHNYQDGDTTPLCDNCCKALKLLEKEPEALQLYAVWKNKSELSNGMIRDETCRFF